MSLKFVLAPHYQRYIYFLKKMGFQKHDYIYLNGDSPEKLYGTRNSTLYILEFSLYTKGLTELNRAYDKMKGGDLEKYLPIVEKEINKKYHNYVNIVNLARVNEMEIIPIDEMELIKK